MRFFLCLHGHGGQFPVRSLPRPSLPYTLPMPRAPSSQNPAAAPAVHNQRLLANPRWRCVDFISDLHLQESDPDTFMAWRRYMAATEADAIFILGDWFEVWVGDDALTPPSQLRHTNALSLEQRCARVCQATGERAAIYVMHGNRDFLMGSDWLNACKAQALPDPTVLSFAGQTLLLSHGDALCTADTDYQAFRQQVRSSAWQSEFLAKPLAQRQQIARSLRDSSEARKQQNNAQGQPWADVDASAVRALLRQHGCNTLLHGHTHMPGQHPLGDGLRRLVLSDWDMRATAPRAQALRWRASDSGQFERLDLAAATGESGA